MLWFSVCKMRHVLVKPMLKRRSKRTCWCILQNPVLLLLRPILLNMLSSLAANYIKNKKNGHVFKMYPQLQNGHPQESWLNLGPIWTWCSSEMVHTLTSWLCSGLTSGPFPSLPTMQYSVFQGPLGIPKRSRIGTGIQAR